MDLLTIAKLLIAAAALVWVGVDRADHSCLLAIDDIPLRPIAPPQILRGQLCRPQAPCEPALLWAGPIPFDGVEQFGREIALMQQYPDGRHARWICLWSGGGAVATADELGRSFKWMGLDTCVVPVEEAVPGTLSQVPRKENGVLCASACVALFLGGVRKTMHPDAALGVHRSRIDGPDACLPFMWRGHIAEMGEATRRILVGSPWRLEAWLGWHTLRTANTSITALRANEVAQAAGANAAVAILNAVWRPAGFETIIPR